MSNNLFTLMIIPRRKSNVKRFSFSSKALRTAVCVSVLFFLVCLYVVYDYASIKRDRAELERLRTQTVVQSQHIHDFAIKVDEFADRMEELRQFDKKLRILAKYQIGRDKKQPLGIGGPDNEQLRLSELLDQDQEKLISGMRKGISQLNDDASYRAQSFNELLKFLREQKSLLAATPSVWPVKGWVTSEFGYRESPFDSGNEFHRGIDIATRMGKEIVSPADGLVIEIGHGTADGNYLRIDHGHGFSTYYAHLSKVAIKQGNRVRRGDLIAYVGNTGRSTGPHLHYGVYINHVPVNPRKYFK
jgi:murein DD-endopeptidase MepM/ murein hydrolase activator NlpD